jgi:UDP-N-acetylmuramyl pentapeptide synthase
MLVKEIVLKFIYFVLAQGARRVIKRFDPFVIAITGSVGKSTTKDAIYEVMIDRFGKGKVFKTHHSLNGEIGIPLTILGYTETPTPFAWPVFLILFTIKSFFFKEYPAYLVLEMGLEHAGDMKYFGTIVNPKMIIITSLGGAHLANFKDLADYQREKLAILEIASEPKHVIVCADDPVLSRLPDVTTISLGEKRADFVASDIRVSVAGTDFRINRLGQKIAVHTKLLGKHLIYSQLFAFAVANYFEMRSLEIAKSLERLEPLKGRMRLLPGKDGIMLIDDTYNSNPTSLKAALEALEKFDKNRRIAVIGNMNELGAIASFEHQKIGQFAKGKCDLAVFVGENAKAMATAYGEGAIVYKDRFETIEKLPKLLLPGDVVLIKASQNKNFFEEITKSLLRDPKDRKYLVRQSEFWMKKKNG